MKTIAMDAHVHFYAEYDTSLFLDCAARNLSALQSAEHPVQPACGYLLMTESHGDNWFASIASAQLGNWRYEASDEAASCKLRKETNGVEQQLIVVAGHQVVTAEGLEVLVIGTQAKPADGQQIRQVIDAALSDNLLTILPWGFGKWTFARGRLIKALIDEYGTRIFLGDNAGRLAMGSIPALMKYGVSQGLCVLPGTDTLPLAREAKGVGAYGAVLTGTPCLSKPFAWLYTHLQQLTLLESVGPLEVLPAL